jgi:pilus assembly protein CpaB
MKPKALMLLAVALVCGLVAMMGVQQAMSGSKAAKVEAKKVYVAAKDLKPGVPLTKEDVVLKEIAAAAVPKDAVTTPEQYEECALKVAILGGEIVTLKKLHEKGKGYGTSNQIPKGMRVMTITTDANNAHSGMLNAGDKVDVFVTFKKAGNKRMETKVLLEACEVFATEARTQQNGAEKDAKEKSIKNVSLLLLPEQVPYVKVAQAKGTLSLMLRNPLDDEVVNTKRVDESLLEELNDSVGGDDYAMFNGDSGELLSSGPADVAPEGPVSVPSTPPPAQNVQDFVQQNQTGAPDPNAAPTAPPVDPNAWTIQVYNGSKLTSLSVTDQTKKDPTSLTGWLNKLVQPK